MKTIQRFLIGLGMVLWAASACMAEENRPDLVGRVVRNDDSPVTNATVFVYTAGPKTGTGVVCPSCYPDCRKKAATDANGSFMIPSLDPKLIFRLLVVAPGHTSRFAAKTDPPRAQ